MKFTTWCDYPFLFSCQSI